MSEVPNQQVNVDVDTLISAIEGQVRKLVAEYVDASVQPLLDEFYVDVSELYVDVSELEQDVEALEKRVNRMAQGVGE